MCILDVVNVAESLHFDDLTIELLVTQGEPAVMRFIFESGGLWVFSSSLPDSLYVIDGQIQGIGRLPERILGDFTHYGRHNCDYGVIEAKTRSECIVIGRRQQFLEYKHMHEALTQLAYRLAQKHDETAQHCERISRLSLKVGRRLNLPPDMLYALKLGGYFHDTGKLQIPNSILDKPGPLSTSEWQLVQQHTKYGRRKILELGFDCFREIAMVIGQHHERIDGSGYPHGLISSEIHICASIVAVVDSFDAMTEKRPYNTVKTSFDALQEIQSLRGVTYHPEVVDAFTEVIRDDD